MYKDFFLYQMIIHLAKQIISDGEFFDHPVSIMKIFFFLIKYINGSEIQFVISFVFLYITTSEGIGNLEATFPPIASHFPCKLGNSQEQFSCLIKVNFSRLLFLESFDYLEKKPPLKSKKRGIYI